MGALLVSREVEVPQGEAERWRVAGERLRSLSPCIWRQLLECTEASADLVASLVREEPPLQ